MEPGWIHFYSCWTKRLLGINQYGGVEGANIIFALFIVIIVVISIGHNGESDGAVLARG